MLLDITSSFYSWIRGGLFALFIYHFIFYLQNNDKLHKCYSIYLLCLVIYLMRDVIVNPTVQYLYQYLSFSIQYVGYVFFIQFCRDLTKSQEHFPKIDKLAKLLSVVLLVFAGTLMLVQFLWGYEVQKEVVALSVPVATICALSVFYLLLKSNSRHAKFLLLGSVFFLVFANISAVKMVKGEMYLINWPVHRMFYYFLGAFVQCLIFAVLIGSHFREIIERKQEAELNLLKQSNQIYELKMIALKSQISPHFLFNSLNSINNYVIHNEVDKASDYITKFSSLIRNVLQVSNENLISLKEELEIIAIYVHLEQMRLKNGFQFKTIIDPALNTERLKVVPLFLQPFIENAIWHGLSSKSGDKTIVLMVEKKEKMVKVSITDNGIGIKKSAKNKMKLKSSKKSLGIKIVKERMDLMYKRNVEVSIRDLAEINETGTEISLVFPLKIK